MTASSDASAQIHGDDLFFECPKCGNSLVVEARGAGLTVNCPDCGEPIMIPEQDTAEELKTEVVAPKKGSELHKALEDSENHVKDLRNLIKELESHQRPLEREHAENLMRVKLIAENVKVILEAGERIAEIIEKPPTEIDLPK